MLGTNYLSEVERAIDATRLESRITLNGAKMFCRMKEIGPEAWLHVLFPPCTNDQIHAARARVGSVIPKIYCDFLSELNGAIFFSGHLSLYGIPSGVKRLDFENRQPFSLINANTLERPTTASNSLFIIGSYGWNASNLCVDVECGRVLCWERGFTRICHEWETFGQMLESELIRLSVEIGRNGEHFQIASETSPCRSVKA